jgi:hypothetical protein
MHFVVHSCLPSIVSNWCVGGGRGRLGHCLQGPLPCPTGFAGSLRYGNGDRASPGCTAISPHNHLGQDPQAFGRVNGYGVTPAGKGHHDCLRRATKVCRCAIRRATITLGRWTRSTEHILHPPCPHPTSCPCPVAGKVKELA